MRVLVDLTFITANGHSGVQIFALRLIQELVRHNTMDFIFMVSDDGKEKVNNLVHGHIVVYNPQTPLSKRFYWFNRFYNAKRINSIAKREKAEVYLIPYVRVNGLTCGSIRQVGIVHDMASCYLSGSIKNFVSRLFFIPLLRSMDKLIAISNNTKKEIIEIANISNDKVDVVYNSMVPPKSGIMPFETNSPYILYVNTLEKYKNVETLIRAFDLIKESIPHKIIIKARKTQYYEQLIAPLIEKLGLTARIQLIEEIFTDDQMTALYKGADLFVSSSTMEGFGYTPIEAAINQCPVICSDIPALLESTMGLLNYYHDPYDYFELSQKIIELLNKGRNEELKHVSSTFINCYSVEKQASKIIKVLEGALSNNILFNIHNE